MSVYRRRRSSEARWKTLNSRAAWNNSGLPGIFPSAILFDACAEDLAAPNSRKRKSGRDAMKIGEFLKRPHHHLVICMPEHSLEDVAKLLHANSIGAMPVCELGMRMVGIVSERDLVRTFATTAWSELQHLRARDIMTTQVVTCSPDDTMQTAQALMRRHHIRHVPVVEAGRVIGTLSIRDTLALRLEESESEINLLRDAVVAARHA
jgi:CBS domain-containing protein